MRKAPVLTLGILLILATVPSLLAADAPAVFKAKCASCHGADATGQTSVGKMMKIRDFHSADVQKQSDAELKTTIENGKGKMPSFKGKLTNEEVASVVTFIRSLKK